jgi:hypothetical protein
MGGAKNQQITEWEQGWSSVDKRVCADCLSDEALAASVQSAVESTDCDYCGQQSGGLPIAAPVEVLLDTITEGLRSEYGHPDDEGVMFVSRDGGYMTPVTDTWDLLDDLDVANDRELHADLSNAIAGPWCQRNPYRSSPAEALSWGWAGFRTYVTHVSRYMFHLPLPDAEQQREDGEIPPQDMLATLAETVKNGKLTRVLPEGTRWVRSRPHSSAEHFVAAKDLGSPPSEAAKTNRMSAGGISAFYGAKSHAGALAEVTGYTADDYATVGTWESARPMLVIDLVDLPNVPSLFDPEQRHRRSDLLFLHGFAADVRRPARPDDKEYLDYIPTQVVAEYFRQLMQDDEGNRAMGVLWRSALDPTVTNCVLFVDNEGCVEHRADWSSEATAWLGLIPGSIQRGPLTDTSAWVKEDPTSSGL